MVSLARSPSRSAVGGFSFANENSINTDDDEIRILQPVLGCEDEFFQPLGTVTCAVFQIIVCVLFSVLAIALVLAWPLERHACEPFYFMAYGQIFFWIFMMLTHFYIGSCHEKIRRAGYLDFVLDIRVLYAMPSHIVTLGNVAILLVSSIVHQVYGLNLETKCENPAYKFMTPVIYEAAVVLVQNIIMMPFLVSYMMRVMRFNRVQPPPDVQREEWLASVIDDSVFKKGEVGFRERTDQTALLLEQQADLIRYLKEHNAHLGQKLVQLSARLGGEHD
ncbi:transmembrane protein 192 isoform X2 [Neocloeon triangulifer]|uniref:transmembrane protein 192 isoform X2 n=1 Tax=Neocloeon triangulifer TaxID=2078957 RepID=UPI00286EBDAD|nr:transmembrane protein 192 isoform X2 [Neocloeon triangulifer]XP_059472165.1 transmembrane protein 192 isoform X2 [Neocloeon triangulifer]